MTTQMCVALLGLILLIALPAYAASAAETILGYAFVFLVVLIVVFLILREVMCWYFKINERLGILMEIRDLLSREGRVNAPQAGAERAASGSVVCPSCHREYDAGMRGRYCEQCGAQL